MADLSPVVTAPAGLLDLHIAALYRSDEEGLLLESNEAAPAPAPRVFVGRTESGVVCVPRHDLADGLAAELRGLAAELPPYPEGRGEVEIYAALEAAVAADAPVGFRWHGLAYDFGEPPQPAHPEVVEISEDRGALVGQFAEFQTKLDEMPPFFGIVRDGAVVSGCYSARLTDAAAEAGVDTNPEQRGQGFAAAVVNSWRIAIEESGRTALYSTSYDNVSSQKVASRLGLRQYAETLSLT